MVKKKFSEILLEEADKIVETIAKDDAYLTILRDQKDKIDEICNLIEKSRAMHCYGKGRSGNPPVALALRLKNFGYKVWFGGDVIKERIYSGDIVFLFSGSGETNETVNFADQGKKAGAKIIGITTYENSTLGKLSDVVFYLPGGLEKSKGWEYIKSQLSESELYGGGLFELFAYLFQETLVTAIGKYKGIKPSIVAETHVRD